MAGVPPFCVRGMAGPRDAAVPWREANQPDIVRASQMVFVVWCCGGGCVP